MNSQFNLRYPSNLTSRQWKHIERHIPAAKPGGRPRTLCMREVVNAILYVLVGGIQWRMLPLDFPKWQSVYYYFRRWYRAGVWKRMHDTLRALLRQHHGRHKHPTAAILDSQSVKSTHVPGSRGFDAGKNVSGRKRHLLVDTLGLVLAVLITSADVSDAQGARWLLASLQGFCKKLRLVWVDGGYRGELVQWVALSFIFHLVPILRSDKASGFQLLPRRWVVERTFAWLGLHRRLATEYEEYMLTSENFIYIAMIRLMARKLP